MLKSAVVLALTVAVATTARAEMVQRFSVTEGRMVTVKAPETLRECIATLTKLGTSPTFCCTGNRAWRWGDACNGGNDGPTTTEGRVGVGTTRR
jgi:hypothetical protein